MEKWSHCCVPGTATETDAVQALLARYLQRRLQNAVQISTPPPPSVLFSPGHRARIRQTLISKGSLNAHNYSALRNSSNNKDRRDEVVDDYDDYEDDLQGFEDSERGRTRIDLFGNIRRPEMLSDPSAEIRILLFPTAKRSL